MMGTVDIDTELSSSRIVEDDLNGVFNSLEPLEDPKDDMYFFGGKDELQKIREKNPGNTTDHKPNAPNKPAPPLSHAFMDNNSHVSISPSSFFSRPNDPSCLHPGSTSSPIYLDNNFIGVGHVSTISPLPPQLSTAAEIQHHDRPARILRDKPTNKVHRAAIPKRSKSPHNNSARVPLGPYSNRATTPTNIVSPPPPLPTPTLLHSSLSNIFPSNSRKESYPANPLSHSDSYIPNITASSSNNTLNQPNITPASSNFANLAHAPTKRKSSDSKRRRGSSSHANRANPANPVNLANPANHANPNNPANPNPNNLANLGHRGNPASNALYNTNNAMSNSGLFTTSNTTTSTARSTPLNQTVEIYPLSLTNSETINQDENMKQQGEHKSTLAIPKQEPDTFANSHAFSTPTTTTTTTSTTSTNNNNSFNNSGDANNMVHNNIMNNNARKMVANYPFAVMPNSLAYYNYFNGMPLQHMYVSPHPLMYQSEATPLHDPNVRIIDNNPSVNQGATNEVPTSYQQPNLTNPNDIYSYLYFNNNNNNNNAIGYNNTAYGNNNNPHPYARTTPPPDASPYNIYNYSNLYNNMYEYPNYTSNNARNFSQGQAYMNTFGGFAEQSNPEQHPSYATEGTYREDYTEKRTERSHRSKRSKRSTRDSDDESRKSRKSKSRSRSKHKSSTRHSHPSDDELPDYELLEFSTPNKGTAYNGPPSPYLVATKPKKANLFENTPKIKLGEPEGAKTKISKLGKKLLEAVGLDWSVAPFASPKFSTFNPNSLPSANLQASSIFSEYDCNPEKKTELLYFIGTNIEAMLSMSTKIDISLKDFKSSNLGAKVRERMDVLQAVRSAVDLGLVSYLILFLFGWPLLTFIVARKPLCN